MKTMFFKELHEQRSLLVISTILILIITIIHSINHHKNETISMDHLMTPIAFIWMFVAGGAVTIALSTERDRDSNYFIDSLPIASHTICWIKLTVAVITLIISIAISLFLFFCFGFTDFFTDPEDMSLLVNYIVLCLCCTMFSTSICRYGFTAMLLGILLPASLCLIFNLIRVFWLWFLPSPIGYVLILEFGLVVISIYRITRISRGFPSSNFITTIGVLSLVMIIAIMMRIEYENDFYQTPPLSDANKLIILPDQQAIIYNASVSGTSVLSNRLNPYYQFDLTTGNTERISKRFQIASQFRNGSPSGRFIFFRNNRNLLGSFNFLEYEKNSRTEEDFSRQSILLRTDSTCSAADDVIYNEGNPEVLDIKTRTFFPLDTDEEEPIQYIGWHPINDQLIGIYKSDTHTTALGLFSPSGGRLERELENPLTSICSISQDGRHLIKYEMITGQSASGTKALRYFYKTIGDQTWQSVSARDDIPLMSPDHKWEFHSNADIHGELRTLIMKTPDNQEIPLGVTRTDKIFPFWATDNNRFVFVRHQNEEWAEIGVFETQERLLVSFPFKINDSVVAINQVNYLDITNDARYVAFSYRRSDSDIVIFDLSNGSTQIIASGVRPLGWMNSQTYLYLDRAGLHAWSATTQQSSMIPQLL